jgi:hypothetical protein
MGAELILAYVVSRKSAPLDWDAGLRAVDALSEDQAEEIADAINISTATDARKELKEAINYIREEPNDVVWLTVGDYRLHLSGGESWGDDPCNGFTYITNLSYAPSVMEAIGFLPEGE